MKRPRMFVPTSWMQFIPETIDDKEVIDKYVELYGKQPKQIIRHTYSEIRGGKWGFGLAGPIENDDIIEQEKEG